MSLTVTDILKFRESENDPWQRLLLQANINFNLIYPVGSIYMSTVNANPATLFGGTWEQLEDRFLLGAGTTYTAGDTGGEAEHTLTVDEMPSHSHNLYGQNDSSMSDYMAGSTQPYGIGTSGNEYTNRMTATGGDAAHNNMPPYIVVYMWKRLTLSPSLTPLPMNVLGDVASQNIVPVSMGGTGADNAVDARTNLGIQLLPTVIVDNTYSTASIATFDKTYTVSGSGVIAVFASVLSDDTDDYGRWQARIYHNGNLIMGEGNRFTTTCNYTFGASTSAPIQVSNGDTIRIYLYITKSGRKDAYRRFMCFGGCTVS